MASAAEQNARAIINRLTLGMPAQVVQAVLDAGERVAWQVDTRASLMPANVSRKVAAVSGQGVPTSVRFGKPFIASLITGRGYFADTADDSTKISLRWESAALPGYQMGDKDQDLNLAVLAEVSTGVPQLKPWTMWPLEESVLTVTAATLVGAATVVFGMHGLYLNGFGASA